MSISRLFTIATCSLAAFSLYGTSVVPDRLDFGPYELASPVREARVKLGPDETPAVRKAVADMLDEVEA